MRTLGIDQHRAQLAREGWIHLSRPGSLAHLGRG
jgi:hypothetical protein